MSVYSRRGKNKEACVFTVIPLRASLRAPAFGAAVAVAHFSIAPLAAVRACPKKNGQNVQCLHSIRWGAGGVKRGCLPSYRCIYKKS